MTEPITILTGLLTAAAIGQLSLAALNMRLDRILYWESELQRMSLLMRQVFYVHKWFISITLLIFGAVTLRFTREMAGGASDLARWLAAGIGFFWAVRTTIQWVYYDRSHWRGQRGRTAVHWILTVCYGGCAAVYLLAAFGHHDG